MERIKLSRSAREVKELIAQTYPEYKGRKIFVEKSDIYHMENYWSGGTKRYAIAIKLATMETMPAPDITTNPYHGEAHVDIAIPDGFAIVEHTIFCGRDIGISVIVNSNTFPKMITA